MSEEKEYLIDKRSTEEMLMDMTLENIHKEAEDQKAKVYDEFISFVNDKDCDYDMKTKMEIAAHYIHQWLRLNALSEMSVCKYFDKHPTTLSHKVYHFSNEHIV